MNNVIITGSSNGFGLKAAKDFADKGYQVFATMRNPNGKNANAKAELESHSTQIKVVNMDVTNDPSVREAMSTILAEAGNIDVLINNAGIMYLGITEAFSVEQAKFQMETNYFGAIRVMQSVLPSMRKAGSGLIIKYIIPALLMSTSIFPASARIVDIASFTEASLVTSISTTLMLAEWFSNSAFTLAFFPLGLRIVAYTLLPFSAKSLAAFKPNPLLLPVMMVFFIFYKFLKVWLINFH
jgi:NAD(P)-dependent dehydrogenase (short-subunit alcohol dehydrogenase family)